METEIKEKELLNLPKPVRVEVLENLIPKIKTNICKIKCSGGGFGTGFFCNIPYKWQLTLKVLITNNHILKEKDLLGNKIIKFSINNEKKQDKISQLELENRKLKEQLYKNRTTTFSNNSLSKNNLFMNKFNDFNILNKNPNISNNSSAVNKENKSHNLEFDENVINKLLSQLNEKEQTIGLLQNEIKQLKKSNNPFGDFSIIGSGEKFNENFIDEDINFIEQINKSQKDINKLKIDNNTLNQSAGKLPNENIQKNNNDNFKEITNVKETNNNNNSKNIKIGSNILIGNVDNEELYNEEENEKNAQLIQ
jgi:hypothetical protein